MKKATNSKNKGKISKLFPIMQEHLGKSMNLARVKLMALLLEALVSADGEPGQAGQCHAHHSGQGVKHAPSAKVPCRLCAGL